MNSFASGFSRTFWVANTLELFERLAFYGSKAVLAVYLVDKVGLTEDGGKLAGLFSSLIYALPILAGVIVDRFGFRKTLIACFSIFAAGYFLIGLAGMEAGKPLLDAFGTYNYVVAALVFTAVGGSLIKPCIVGTVSMTTTTDKRALGFSIYYTLVNIGGAIGPLLALTIRQGMGIEYVLIMSSITSLLLILGAFVFFKEPASDELQERRTFGKVFADMLVVFSNVRFILFLIIFSGFWLMFWQIFLLVPFYGKEILYFEEFEILETVDAIVIIVTTIPMAALAKKLRPIHAMLLGMGIAACSWILMGSSVTLTAAMISIGIFALGEATQSPRFYEYVSSIAPKHQIGTYMGFAFLPVAIGAFTAGYIADYLRLNFMMTDVHTMWYIVAAIGIGSTILLWLYDVLIAPKTKTN